MSKKSTRSSDQKAQGNTKPVPKDSRSRGYCLTIFNKKERDDLIAMGYRYIIIGKETCPTTGKRHWQCFVYFKLKVTFDALKKKLPTAHIEMKRGTIEHNQIYCSKENVWFEDGEPPHQGKKVSAETLKEMTNHEIIDMDPRCSNAYIRARDILKNNMKISDYRKKVEAYYIWGESGAGKTEKALEIIERNAEEYGEEFNEIAFKGDFYIGTGDAKIALYDEWRDSHMKPSEFINLIDYNKHNMNIKGGSMKNEYRLIIITTVQDIKNIYQGICDEEPRKQWERRLQVIHVK